MHLRPFSQKQLHVSVLVPTLVLLTVATLAAAQVTIKITENEVLIEAPADSVIVVQAENPPPQNEPAPPVQPAPNPPTDPGFTNIEPTADSRIIYVSADGNDRNAGDSPASPLKTLSLAVKSIRHFSNDQLLLKAGDTFEGGFGTWDRPGKSAEQPILVGVYGQGPRPVIRTYGDGLLYVPPKARFRHVVFQGLHATAAKRDPADPAYNLDDIPYGEGGVIVHSGGDNILFEDCKIEHYSFNMVFQAPSDGALKNVTVRRCILTDSWKHWNSGIGGGHSSGIFAKWVDGLTIEDSVIDNNGWNEDAPGAKPTIFNHNLYVQRDCKNIIVRRNIIANAASHGLQLRPGGLCENNTFWRNPMAMFSPVGPIRFNVVLESTNLDDKKTGRRGEGLVVHRQGPGEVVPVHHNLVAHKLGNASWTAALCIMGPEDGFDAAKADLKGNVVCDWTPVVSGAKYAVNGNDTRIVDEVADPATYIDGGMAGLVAAARNRGRGEWDQKWSAAGFNRFMREASDMPLDP